MPNYRRDYSGCCWFFTVVTHQRAPIFSNDNARDCLGKAVRECRSRYPFYIDAWVVLPDHMHCVWTLPDSDRDYSRRWGIIKRRFTQLFRIEGGPQPFWQRRFWAHRIDDEMDYGRHVDYVHYNPVKHGYARMAAGWPWSTFHRHMRKGVYPPDWYQAEVMPDGIGRGE